MGKKVSGSPFVCTLMSSFQEGKNVYLVLKECQGLDLSTILRNHPKRSFSEKDAMFYVASIVEAFGEMHKGNMVHHDLKTENVAIDAKGNVKLIDFGLSKIEERSGRQNICGTPECFPPEVATYAGSGRGSSAIYDGKLADWWTLGIFCYEMVMGVSPFRGKNMNETYRFIQRNHRIDRHERLYRERWNNLSPKCRDFILGLLATNPQTRLGNHGATEVRSHPWFEGFNWRALRKGSLTPPLSPKIRNGFCVGWTPRNGCFFSTKREL